MFRNLLSKKAVIPQIILNPDSLEYNKEAGVKNLQVRSKYSCVNIKNIINKH